MTIRRRIQRLDHGTRRRLLSLPRWAKLGCMVAFDLVAIALALTLAVLLRHSDQPLPDLVEQWWWLWVTVPPAAVPIFVGCGLYRQVIRYIGARAAMQILVGVAALALVIPATALLADYVTMFRAAVMVNFFVIACAFIGASRFAMRSWFGTGRSRKADRVVVWGAGYAGVQLAQALHAHRRWTPVAFVDDDRKLWGRIVNRLPCISPDRLASLTKRRQVGTIILALPSASRQQRRRILDRLEPLGLSIKTVPGIVEILSGRGSESEVREVSISDLLGRNPIPAHESLLRRNIEAKTVLVTGAGGSIGSELCRQILALSPKRLILLERSEFALYSIDRELRQRLVLETGAAGEVELISLLGSAGDQALVERLFSTWPVDTVYHAAAHKHVPIVEENVPEGIANNTLATWTTATAALKHHVSTFVLISTDKAVRPTNVMGASKRMAEMVLQGLMGTQRDTSTTRFSMVRFGNVLGSSGSVIPLFREQIRMGGPVTVTHPKITRFFMTVEEAVQLVIQAGSMAEGGEVHLLDMGEPVPILDLARRMIQLSGHTIRDEHNPDGSIAIEYTGLRPGEKLYEELLISDDVCGTVHPRIMRGDEEAPPWERVESWLMVLQQAVATGDCAAIRSVLNEAVAGYAPANEIHDVQWRQRPKPQWDDPAHQAVSEPRTTQPHGRIN
ncbi:MAG: polysaccharide biosynthesis protein [Phycisphaerales bacterium]|nr:polysaccharide biosynthesis protein [Phycisphaerales bacterium]